MWHQGLSMDAMIYILFLFVILLNSNDVSCFLDSFQGKVFHSYPQQYTSSLSSYRKAIKVANPELFINGIFFSHKISKRQNEKSNLCRSENNFIITNYENITNTKNNTRNLEKRLYITKNCDNGVNVSFDTGNYSRINGWLSKHRPSYKEFISLPILSQSDFSDLKKGRIIRKQTRHGRTGSGFIVLEVDADPDSVFNVLSQVPNYERVIPTVKSLKVYRQINKPPDSPISRQIDAELYLSRFYLKVNVVHSIFRTERLIKFCLDPKRQNLVLKKAEGFWYVDPIVTNSQNSSNSQHNKHKREKSRVYLNADIVASPLLPSIIVDYASSRALSRATRWIKPYFSKNFKMI